VGPPASVRALAEAERLRFTVLTHWKNRVIGFVSRS